MKNTYQLHAGYISVTYYSQLIIPLFIGTFKSHSSIKHASSYILVTYTMPRMEYLSAALPPLTSKRCSQIQVRSIHVYGDILFE